VNGRRFSKAAVTTIALVAAGLPVAGGSDAAWSPPVTAGRGASTELGTPLLATSARHGSTIAWRNHETGAIFARRIFRDGALGPTRKLGRTELFINGPWIAVDPSGATVAVWYEQGLLRARRMSPRGKLQPVHLVTPPEAVGNYHREAGVAVDARGDATIVWPRELVSPASGRGLEYITPPTVHARRLTANEELGPILDISTSDGYNLRPRIAVGPSGRATVAWQFGASVHATTIDRDGTVGEVRDLSEGSRPELGVDARGNATIVWISSAVVARRILAGGALGPLLDLGPISPGFYEEPSLGVAVDRAGSATVAWQSESWLSTILSRRITVNDTLGPPLTLSVRSDESEIAVDPAGNATAVWVRSQSAVGYDYAIRARRLSRHGKLGTGRTVGSARSAALSGPKVVADARGVVTVAWRDALDRRYPQALVKVVRLVPPRGKRGRR
jgi:hypothetical protein